MEVAQLERFKRALKTQQTVAIHDLGENREIIAVERTSLTSTLCKVPRSAMLPMAAPTGRATGAKL